jgi:hypothetical protein
MQFNVTPATNNSSPVVLSCTNGSQGLPLGYSCTLQPSTVNLANGVPVPVTLTLTPTSNGAAIVNPTYVRKRVGVFLLPFGSGPLWPLGFLFCVAVVVLVCVSSREKYARAILGFGLACIITFVFGCGGGSSFTPPPPPPPPPGPFTTSTAVSADSAKVAQGAPITLTVKVTGQGTPTGSVSFISNAGVLGTANLVNGAATLNTTLAYVGTYSISAQYNGDSKNLISTSPNLNETVTGSTVFQVSGQTSTLFHAVNVTATVQ